MSWYEFKMKLSFSCLFHNVILLNLPNPSPLHSFAHLSLSHFEEAVDAYEKAVALDPKNTNLQNGLKNAKAKLAEKNGGSSTSTPTAAAAAGGGMPDLSSLLGGAGGAAGLAGLMNNPQISQMLNNPDLMNSIMSNPALMNLYGLE